VDALSIRRRSITFPTCDAVVICHRPCPEEWGVDWSQEARVVEVLFDPENEQLVLATTPLEHAAPIAPSPERLTAPVDLAAWSRELAFNNYQKRDRMLRESSRGTVPDRCGALVLPLEGRGVSQALTEA
jgi:hypothetical protein